MLIFLERVCLRVLLWYIAKRISGQSNQQIVSDVGAAASKLASPPAPPKGE